MICKQHLQDIDVVMEVFDRWFDTGPTSSKELVKETDTMTLELEALVKKLSFQVDSERSAADMLRMLELQQQLEKALLFNSLIVHGAKLKVRAHQMEEIHRRRREGMTTAERFDDYQKVNRGEYRGQKDT